MQNPKLFSRPIRAFHFQRGQNGWDGPRAKTAINRGAMRGEAWRGRGFTKLRHGADIARNKRSAQSRQRLTRCEMRGQPGVHRIRAIQPRAGQRQPHAKRTRQARQREGSADIWK